MSKPYSAASIREVFSCILKYPDLGSRKLAEKTGISRSSIDRFRIQARELDLTADMISSMTDEEINTLFNREAKRDDFVIPDWEEIRKYLDTPRKWSGHLNTIKNAWYFLYLKKLFPDHVNGQSLPAKCMSERTFYRRYNEYLENKGLAILKHQPNISLNFGPASMLEIDTIGDRFTYIDINGTTCQAVIFTAVLKYSGYLYAEAMPAAGGINWASAIINACWYIGGTCEVIRADNDSAICNHGTKFNKGRSRLRPAVFYTVRDLNMTVDLCPIRSPRWKGSNERTNGILQTELFADPAYPQPLHAADIHELNKLIRNELTRINHKPLSRGQLSRAAVFELYEKPHLHPLPLIKPVPHYLSEGRVQQNGYVTYQKNCYYAGLSNRGKDIIIENDSGLYVRLLQVKSLKEIASYDLDKNLLPKPNYHKADKFKTEKERLVTRDKAWFLQSFAAEKENHADIDAAIEMIWRSLTQTPAVASRLCAAIWNLYKTRPGQVSLINKACALAVGRNRLDDFSTYLKDAFECLAAISEEGVTTASFPLRGIEPEHKGNFIRGGDYYDRLIKIK